MFTNSKLHNYPVLHVPSAVFLIIPTSFRVSIMHLQHSLFVCRILFFVASSISLRISGPGMEANVVMQGRYYFMEFDEDIRWENFASSNS